jgi:thioredoxin reductase (NADPH)
MDYDVIIVGGGPAGLAAGTHLARARCRVMLLDKECFGGQAMNVEWIEDYPGPGERVSGHALASQMVDEAEKSGVRMELGEVIEVESYSGCKSVRCEDGKTLTCSVVILAGGLRPKSLGVPGEAEFQGKGMIHCAVCDAGLYADQAVAVCGGGDAGIIEALYLANFAAKVIVIEVQSQLSAASSLRERARAHSKLEIRYGQKVVEIAGDESVTGIQVKEAATGRMEKLGVRGVLVHAGFEPVTGYLQDVLPLGDQGYIAVNDGMETAIPGMLAAGDIRGGSPRRVAAAVNDGKKAAASAERILKSG